MILPVQELINGGWVQTVLSIEILFNIGPGSAEVLWGNATVERRSLYSKILLNYKKGWTFSYVETKVRYLKHPSAVNQAVVAVQVGVELDRGVVEVDHPPDNVTHQAGDEHLVQFHVLVVHNVSGNIVEPI